jgi:hypothetical protein
MPYLFAHMKKFPGSYEVADFQAVRDRNVAVGIDKRTLECLMSFHDDPQVAGSTAIGDYGVYSVERQRFKRAGVGGRAIGKSWGSASDQATLFRPS